ncbi:hypothetical protein ACHAWF_017344 [Thalassiosira exigua]
MKAYSALPILCLAILTSTGLGQNQRRLQPNEEVVRLIATTDLFSEVSAVMVSRLDPVKTQLRPDSCSSPSARWLKRQIDSVSDDDLSNFFQWQIYTLPFAYKLFVEPIMHQNERPGYFGIDGQYTEEVNAILDQAQEFWSDSGVDDDIRVLCAHGSDLADRHEKLIPTLELMFGGSYDDDYTIFDHATDIQDLVVRLPGGYNNPLVTFNAFANDEGSKNDSPSIIIGDGYFEFQEAIGLISEGPEYVLAHEHAHHLQYLLGVPDEAYFESSRAARREELMADAFSAYFLAHDRGRDMEADEIASVHAAAYSVGDCETNHDDHHGTPHQRRCASRWGASIADLKGIENLGLGELKNRFDTWYGRVEDLDASCEFTNNAANMRFTSYCILQASAFLLGGTLLSL